LLLVHGWPQSSFMWRHLIPKLSERLPLFVPDLPGYGYSTPSQHGSDKLTYSTALTEALHAHFGPKLRVILGGHDRGGRTMHRLSVSRSEFPNLDVLGLFMADIVPTAEQFASFARPAAGIGYFHWSFLPRGDLAVGMITAYGPSRLLRELMSSPSITGNEAGTKSFQANGAIDVYADHFEKESVVRAGAEDYAAAATVDYELQLKDQSEGRKIDVPTLVLYSEKNLGAMHDVPAVWGNWVNKDVRLEIHGIGDGAGHYFLEEVPDKCLSLILSFVASLGY